MITRAPSSDAQLLQLAAELRPLHTWLTDRAHGTVDSGVADEARALLATERWQRAGEMLARVDDLHDLMMRNGGAHALIMEHAGVWGAGLTDAQVIDLVTVFEDGCDAVEGLEEIATCRLPYPLTVFRGLPVDPESVFGARVIAGAQLRSPGGLSTSLEENTCWAYAEIGMREGLGDARRAQADGRAWGTMLQIEVPAGYPGAYLQAGLRPVPGTFDEEEIEAFISEQIEPNLEWVIAPDSTLEVLDVQITDRCVHVHCQLIDR